MLLRHYIFILIICLFTGAMCFQQAETERKPVEPPHIQARLPIDSETESAEDVFTDMLNKQSEVVKIKDEIKENQDTLAQKKKVLHSIEVELHQTQGINITNNAEWYNLIGVYKNWKEKNKEIEKLSLRKQTISNSVENIRKEIKEGEDRLERAKRDAEEARERIKEFQNLDRDVSIELDDIRAIQNKFATFQTFQQVASGFIAPVYGEITSPFGYRTHPIYGDTRFHSGVDIGVDYGTPVRASAAGIVVLSEWYGGFGNAVIISHGNGAWTLYGHNSELTVNEGDIVQKGQVIALAGSTGNSTGPHVHFSMWRDEELVNPLDFVRL